jgi:hypothetical protein
VKAQLNERYYWGVSFPPGIGLILRLSNRQTEETLILAQHHSDVKGLRFIRQNKNDRPPLETFGTGTICSVCSEEIDLELDERERCACYACDCTSVTIFSSARPVFESGPVNWNWFIDTYRRAERSFAKGELR